MDIQSLDIARRDVNVSSDRAQELRFELGLYICEQMHMWQLFETEFDGAIKIRS